MSDEERVSAIAAVLYVSLVSAALLGIVLLLGAGFGFFLLLREVFG